MFAPGGLHKASVVADSNSRKAVNFSSAHTTKRFPSTRCASAIQIVRPLESTAETQPQLQPARLRLSAMISEYVIRHLSTQQVEIDPTGSHRGAYPISNHLRNHSRVTR